MKRLGLYVIKPGGRASQAWKVPPHVFTALRGLRPHLEQLLVGVQGQIQTTDLDLLTELADGLIVQPDITHGALAKSVGEALVGFDQVVLTGSSWFGPIADLNQVFDAMAQVPTWSLLPKASRPAYEGDPKLVMDPDWVVMTGAQTASAQLQGWRESGDELELSGECQFAFRPDTYLSPDPAVMNLPQLIEDGLPFVPISSFGMDPLIADRLAVVPADGFEALRATGIDMSEVWKGLLDTTPLRVLSTNLALTHVLGSQPVASDSSTRTVAILHLYYDDLTNDLMDRVDLIPGEVTVIVTTTDETRRASIEDHLATRTKQYPHEVRIVSSNRGRDISALLVGCADVIADEAFDIVVKLHGKRSLQDDVNASSWFRRHLFDNLLPSSLGVAELYNWFAKDPQLGIVVPPVIHMYYPTMGHAWLGNRAEAESLADRLGLSVPFDETTPVAPYGSMFVARREALVPWLSLGLTWEDFPDGTDYGDGTLSHAVERMFCYVAAGTGRYTGTALGPAIGGIEYGFLEYKLQAVGSKLPAYAVDQVQYLEQGHFQWRHVLKQRMPRLVSRVRPIVAAVRKLHRKPL